MISLERIQTAGSVGFIKHFASFFVGALVALGFVYVVDLTPGDASTSGIDPQLGREDRDGIPHRIAEATTSPTGQEVVGFATIPALNAALSAANRFERRKALVARAVFLAGTNLNAALAEGESLTGFLDQSTYLEAVVGEWAKQDPKAALEFATARDSTAMALALSESALRTVSASDPEAAAQLCQGITTKALRENLVGPVAYDFASSSPERAAAWALSLPDSSSRIIAASQAAKAWAESSPGEAVSWADRIPDLQLRSEAIRSAYSAWAGEDLAAALVDAGALKDPMTKDLVVESISQSAGFDQPEAVLDWLIAQPSNRRYQAEMAAVLSYLTESSPDAATARIETLPPEFRPRAAATVAGTWVANQPEKALEWVSSIADSDEKLEAMRGATALWAENQTDLALDYAVKLTDPRLKDAALIGVIESINNTNSPRAFTVAAQIANAEIRREILTGVLGQIASDQPAEAVRLIDSAPLPAMDRMFLRQWLGQEGGKSIDPALK